MDASTVATVFTLTPDEVAYVETCLARRRELLALAGTAPDGRVLATCEEAAVVSALKIGHDLLAAALAARVTAAEEKKSARPGRAGAAGGGTTAARTRASS
jgi:hypothetical protein